MVLALVVAAGALVLGVYIFVRHQDRAAAVAATLLAAAVVVMWFVGSSASSRLQRELDASRQRVAELEAAPAQRGFTPAARAQLVAALREFVGPTAFVLANASDLETTEYAREIVSILNDAGWEVPASFGMIYRPVLQPGQEKVSPGVIVGISADVPDAFGNAIFNAIRNAGVDATRGPHWPGTEHPISILVGPSR